MSLNKYKPFTLGKLKSSGNSVVKPLKLGKTNGSKEVNSTLKTLPGVVLTVSVAGMIPKLVA